eukprot:8258958-Alexandrium_andersonii.AAC.1
MDCRQLAPNCTCRAGQDPGPRQLNLLSFMRPQGPECARRRCGRAGHVLCMGALGRMLHRDVAV